MPKYLNYGAIGSTIGHELTHGFEGLGRLFNDIGNLKEHNKSLNVKIASFEKKI